MKRWFIGTVTKGEIKPYGASATRYFDDELQKLVRRKIKRIKIILPIT